MHSSMPTLAYDAQHLVLVHLADGLVSNARQSITTEGAVFSISF